MHIMELSNCMHIMELSNCMHIMEFIPYFSRKFPLKEKSF